VALCLLSLLTLASATFWAAFGRHHSDESFYLYCGKLAWEGKVPYRDFFFTQLPLVLYLYGAVARFLSPNPFVARAVSVALTYAVALVVLRFARRSFGMPGAIFAGLLLATDSYAIFHLVISKGYAPGALMLIGALYLARRRVRTLWQACLAGVLVAGATLVRASAAVALATLPLWEALVRRKARTAAAMAMGGLAALLALLLPFAVLEWKGLWFGVWKYHEVSWIFRGVNLAASEAGFRFLPLLLLSAAAFTAAGLAGGWEGVRQVCWRRPVARMLGLLILLLSGLHLFAGARLTEYHALAFPPACVLVGGWAAQAWRVARGWGGRLFLATATAIAGIVGLLFTWPEGTWLRGQPYPGVPQSLVDAVAANTRRGDKVLCLHPEVLLATGREAVPGTEMGPFAILHNYSEPGWKPPGTFTEEDFLGLVEARKVPLVVFREDDMLLLSLASDWRNRRRDYPQRMARALQRGYQERIVTQRIIGGKRMWRWQVWGLKIPD